MKETSMIPSNSTAIVDLGKGKECNPIMSINLETLREFDICYPGVEALVCKTKLTKRVLIYLEGELLHDLAQGEEVRLIGTVILCQNSHGVLSTLLGARSLTVRNGQKDIFLTIPINAVKLPQIAENKNVVKLDDFRK